MFFCQTLLSRGGNRDALNRAGQTPYQVAMLAGAKRVAQILVEFNPADAQPIVEKPVTFTRQVESSIAAERV